MEKQILKFGLLALFVTLLFIAPAQASDWVYPRFQNKIHIYVSENAGLERTNETIVFNFSKVPNWSRSMIRPDCNDIRVVDATSQKEQAFTNTTCNSNEVVLEFACSVPAGSVNFTCADIYFNNPCANFPTTPNSLFVSEGINSWMVYYGYMQSRVISVPPEYGYPWVSGGIPYNPIFANATGLGLWPIGNPQQEGLMYYDHDQGGNIHFDFRNLVYRGLFSAKFNLMQLGGVIERNITYYDSGKAHIANALNDNSSSESGDISIYAGTSTARFNFWVMKASGIYTFVPRSMGISEPLGLNYIGMYNSSTSEYIVFMLDKNNTNVAGRIRDGNGAVFLETMQNSQVTPKRQYWVLHGKNTTALQLQLDNEYEKIVRPLQVGYGTIEKPAFTERVSLSVEPYSQKLGFAQNTSYQIRINNLGNADLYSLSTFVNPDGPRLDYPRSVEVPACSGRTVNLTVFPTGCSVKPNNYTISISAASLSDPGIYSAPATAFGIVPEVSSLSSTIAPSWQQAYPGQSVSYTLDFKNDGNTDQNLTTTVVASDLPASVFWTLSRNATGWISPAWHSDFSPACGQTYLLLNATVPKSWPGFNETVYGFAANTIFSEKSAVATALLQVNVTVNSSMLYKIGTADYLLGKLDQLRQQDIISRQEYNVLKKRYERLLELGYEAVYGGAAIKKGYDEEAEFEKELELPKESDNEELKEGPKHVLSTIKRDILLTYVIDKQLLSKQKFSEKAKCLRARNKYCDSSWTEEFLLYSKYIRGADFRAIKEILESQKLGVLQELAESACKSQRKMAAFRLIEEGNALLSSLNFTMDMNLEEFLLENTKAWKAFENYHAADSILGKCRAG